MSAEEPPFKLRPLPTIEFPILPEDIARERRKKLLIGSSIITLTGLTGALFFLWPGVERKEVHAADRQAQPAVPADLGCVPPSDASAPPPPPPSDSAPLRDPPPRTQSRHRFGQSPGFRPALLSAGLSSSEADTVIAALEGVLDFRRCRPEHEITIERDSEGALKRFEYRASPVQIYEVRRDANGTFRGVRVEVPLEVTEAGHGGFITASLGEAIESAGLGRQLVGPFIEAFENRIDFQSDLRPGDAFKVVVVE
ncbi:MAG: hypothetical protein N2515_08335, partial [Deltaproteobacteria bacterium]|nr:hypothetical protein [Deltaproteobacteria bacterium]